MLELSYLFHIMQDVKINPLPCQQQQFCNITVDVEEKDAYDEEISLTVQTYFCMVL